MALIRCNECNHEISDKAKSCPNCGYILKKDSSRKRKKGNRLFIIGSCISLLGFIYGLSTVSEKVAMKAYAVMHGNYYPPSYYVSEFIFNVGFFGGIILAIIGLIFMIMYRK